MLSDLFHKWSLIKVSVLYALFVRSIDNLPSTSKDKGA